MYIEIFKSIISSMNSNTFMHYHLIGALENKSFVEEMKKSNPELDVEDHKKSIFQLLGQQKYAKHLIEMHYLNPLIKLKKKIEDYKNGVFVDDWGRHLDKMYSDDPDFEPCEKDFWEYLIWKFSDPMDNKKVCEHAKIPDIVGVMWMMSRKTSTAMTEGLIKFFNPTILVPDGDNMRREMTQKEKDNYGLDKSLELLEREFNLLDYSDFCEQVLKIAHSKGDIDLIYNAI
jgi:hypothetical protein